jgi:hypothetical protein
MTFLVFKTTALPDGPKEYSRVGEVQLGGKNGGLIYRSCQRFLNGQDAPWHVTAANLLEAGGYDAGTHSLVIGYCTEAAVRKTSTRSGPSPAIATLSGHL